MTATFTTDDPQEMSIIANIQDVRSLIFDLNAGNIEREYIKYHDHHEEYVHGFNRALDAVRFYLTALNHIQ